MPESFAGTDYPRLREVLDPRLAALPDTELESAFATAFGEGVTPAEYEEFFGGLGRALQGVAQDVGRFAQQAAPVVASGAQGALRGAAAGSALGPWGILGGALTGAAGSALAQHGTGTARDVGNMLSGVVGTAGSLTGGGGLAGLLGGAGRGAPPAAANLAGLLRTPQLAQALSGLLGGGNPTVPAGRAGTPVPATAFAGLLSALAREAESEALADQDGESVPAYLVGPTGELLVDPGDPDQRARRLLALLAGEVAADTDGEAWDDADDAEAWDGAWDGGTEAWDDSAFAGFEEPVLR